MAPFFTLAFVEFSVEIDLIGGKQTIREVWSNLVKMK